jgi:hypothetical protein
VPRSGQFEDRCLWKRSRRCTGSFLLHFVGLFYVVSRADHGLKEVSADEPKAPKRAILLTSDRPHTVCGVMNFRYWPSGRLGLRKVHAQAKSVKSRATAFPQAPQLVQADACALIIPKRKQPISKHCGRRDARIDERSLTFTNSSPSRLMINFLGLLSTAVPEGRILTH